MTNLKSQCPRCHSELHHNACGQVSAKTCRRCGGLWLDYEISAQFSQALHERGRLDVSESARIVGEATARMSKKAHVDTSPDGLPCVVCGNPMRRERLDVAHFDLDICDGHGTWFDRGELPAVAHLCGARAPTSSSDGDGDGGGGGVFKGEGKAAVGGFVLGLIAAILDNA